MEGASPAAPRTASARDRNGKSVPFGLFERMLAGRYLRAKRQHGGVALISVISVTAITLAVMALIIVMSVMNGFRETLLSRILGVNGHVFVDVRGLQASLALRDRIGDLVAGVELLDRVRQSARMQEHVCTAISRADEPEALAGIEPLHGTRLTLAHDALLPRK